MVAQCAANMIRTEAPRIDIKRRQFAAPTLQQLEYPYRLNFYRLPPTAEITLEQFEQWAIDRLRSTDFLQGS